MTEKDEHPSATHFSFPYFFSDTDGIRFEGIEIPIPPTYKPKDLNIYYDTLELPNRTSSWCSKWDTSNYSATIETWLQKEDMENIITNIKPGAVSELFQVLGSPYYYDTSWTGDNTIRIAPNPSSATSTLRYMRKEIILYPKTVSTSPIAGLRDWFLFKIEGYISGSTF